MLVTLRGKGFMSFLSSFLTARGRQIMINKDGCRKGGFSERKRFCKGRSNRREFFSLGFTEELRGTKHGFFPNTEFSV